MECPTCKKKHADLSTWGCLWELVKVLVIGTLVSTGVVVLLAYLVQHLRIEWLPP